MITKDKIIRTALLKLGETDSYNDNRSRVYLIAEELLGNVIDELAYDTAYLFNATTVVLKSTGNTNENGENLFSLPADFLNPIRANVRYRLEGEYIVADENEMIIQYCRKLQLLDFPDYISKLLIYKLATDIAESINSLSSNLQIVNSRAEKEKYEVQVREGWKPLWANLRSEL